MAAGADPPHPSIDIGLPVLVLPQLVAEVPRPLPRHSGSSSIISSLEFDREGSLFATAGVSKRIRWGRFAQACSTP